MGSMGGITQQQQQQMQLQQARLQQQQLMQHQQQRYVYLSHVNLGNYYLLSFHFFVSWKIIVFFLKKKNLIINLTNKDNNKWQTNILLTLVLLIKSMSFVQFVQKRKLNT